MTLLRCAILSISFIVCFFSSHAQPGIYGYDLFTTQSGLTHNHVLSIAQDDAGFLWIGTRDGLSRYDGQEFVSYAHMFDSMGNAWGNAVEAICCYKDEVWIGTRGGLLACLNVKTGTYRKMILPVPQGISHNSIKVIYASDKGKIFAGTYDGRLMILDKDKAYIHTTKISNSTIRNITMVNDDVLVFADKAYRYDGTGKVSLLLPMDVPLISAINRNVLMAEVGYGQYYFYDVLSGKKSVVQDEHFRSFNPLTLIKASRDHFIITNGDVIAIYGLNGQKLSTLPVDENEVRDRWEAINDVIEDKEGNIWIGIDHGLVRITTGKYRFNRFTMNNRLKKLSHNYIRSLYAETNTVWAGTWHGYVNKIEYLPENKQYRVTPFTFKTDGAQATTNAITRLNDKTLVAAGPKGFFRLKGNVFVPFAFASQKTPVLEGNLWTIKQDKRGRIWLSSFFKDDNRIYIIDQKEQTLRQLSHPSMVWNIFEDKNGNMWLGTEEGLEKAIVDPVTDSITFIRHTEFARNKPAALSMWNLLEDSLHNLWIGTTDNGLLYYDTHTRLFTSYSVTDGLPGNCISGLLNITGDKLWLSTTNGLAMMDLHTKAITSYTEADGLISNDFNFKACAATPQGELFWGTKMGIISFHHDSLRPSISGYRLVVTNINVMGNEVAPDDSISLFYHENMLTVKFALLDYTHFKHYYRYRLKGFNEMWSYADERNNAATYTNLPPGEYELQVNAAISPGKWLQEMKSVVIIIKPEFWQTTWFIILTIVLAATLIALIIYLRIKKIVRTVHEKQTIRQKITELELSALQAQMNPHFIFNAIQSIQHFIIRNDELNANEYLTKFAKLMRLFLESSKRKFITLAEEIEILKLYTDLEKLRFEERFELELNVDPMLDVYSIEIPSMLLQPFVENAIIHGLVYLKHKGLLSIGIKETDEGICCIIDDNGIGRAASRSLKKSSHPSRGMELTLDRINSYNELNNSPLCRISIIDKVNPSGEALGTRVEIYIQYSPQ